MFMHHANLEGSLLELKDADGETDTAADITKTLEAIEAKLGERLGAIETKSADRLDKLEARLNRPGTPAAKAAEEPAEIERKAFVGFLRSRPDRPLAAEEQKALSVGTLSAGGYMAPKQFTTDLVRDLVPFSPIRAIADVRNAAGHTVQVNKRTGITNALWQGEAVQTTGSEPSFGQMEISIKTLASHTDVNNQLMDDAEVDIEAEVRLALAEDFGFKEGAAFVSGDGVLQPKGFMNAAGVAETLNGHVANLSADQLMKLMYGINPAYRARGTWVMNGNTLAVIRTLKNGNDDYIWRAGLEAGQPDLLLGRPIVEAPDMPDVEAGAFPIIFGDFKTGYRIYERKIMQVTANPYLLMTTDQTRFHAYRRVGADVVQPLALCKLKMATA